MIDVTKMMNDVADKDKVPAFYGGFWIITQEELERFTASVLDEAASVCENTNQEYEPYTGQPYSLNYTCAEAVRTLKPNVK